MGDTHQRAYQSVPFVEDDPAITEFVQEVLSEDYRVSFASDVPTAIAHLDNDPALDVILLDFLLPGGRYLEVLEKARTTGHTVVFMSDLLEAGSELVAFGYPCLQKPFGTGQLFDAIASALASC